LSGGGSARLCAVLVLNHDKMVALAQAMRVFAFAMFQISSGSTFTSPVLS
jgi:hypothetical protein